MRNSWSVCCQGLDEWSDAAVLSAVRTCLKLDSHFPSIQPWSRANLEVSALQHWNLYHNSKLSISHTPKCDHKFFFIWGFFWWVLLHNTNRIGRTRWKYSLFWLCWDVNELLSWCYNAFHLFAEDRVSGLPNRVWDAFCFLLLAQVKLALRMLFFIS